MMCRSYTLHRPRQPVTDLRSLALLMLAVVATSPASLLALDDEPTSPVERRAAMLEIHGEITDITVESLRRRIEDAKILGVGVIVFDLDTPGGLVTSSIAIADLIRELTEIETVAWVNPNAHSGGAIVAVACDEIVMARSSRMGDSQVIMGGPAGVAAVPEDLQPKAYTPVLADFRASCRLNGYDQNLCEAFVLPDREVWWLENADTGERRFVFREEKLRLLGQKDVPSSDSKDDKKRKDKPDVEPNAIVAIVEGIDTASGASADEIVWKLVETYFDPLAETDVETIQPVVRDDQLLEMSAGEAQAYGFSKGIVRNESELRSRYDISDVVAIAPSWSEGLAYWLTSIYVRGFLMVIILLGAYVEFHTPGVGVPGLAALIALGIFVAAPYLTGLANVWEILCLAVGFALIAIEVFVIPGFGLAGVSGIVLVVAGLLATFIPDEPGHWFPIYMPTLPSSVGYLKTAVITMLVSTTTSLLGMVMLSRFLPRLALFRLISPANPTPSEVQTLDVYHGAARVGDVGRALAPLRPSGKAEFGSVLVDVVTRGEYVESATAVEVIERRGNQVIVRAMES